MTNFFDQLKFK